MPVKFDSTTAKMQMGGLGAGVGGGLGAALAAAIIGFVPSLDETPWEDVLEIGCMLIVAIGGAMFGSYRARNQITSEQVKVAVATDPGLGKEIVKDMATPAVSPTEVKKVIDTHKAKTGAK